MTAEAERFVRDHLALGLVEGLPEISIYRPHSGSGLGRLAGGMGGGAAPYWAFVWAGGAALARHVLDLPDVVAGRRVLDLGAGSGIAGIAGMKAGARSVVAAETDPFGAAALRLNAAANGVTLDVTTHDVTTEVPADVDLILAGDVFYCRPVARRMLAFLKRCRAAGIDVLIGDPGRKDLPVDELRAVFRYKVVDMGSPQADIPAAIYMLDD